MAVYLAWLGCWRNKNTCLCTAYTGLRADRLRLTGSAANALIKLEMLAADVEAVLQVGCVHCKAGARIRQWLGSHSPQPQSRH